MSILPDPSTPAGELLGNLRSPFAQGDLAGWGLFLIFIIAVALMWNTVIAALAEIRS